MMKKITYLKSFLLAAALLVGGSAWAETYWSADFSSAPSGMTYSVTNGTTSIDNGYLFLKQNGGNGDRTLNISFTDEAFTAHDCYSLEFDWGACSSNTNASSMTISSASETILTISWAKNASTATVTGENALTTTLPITGYIKGGGTTPDTWSHFKFNVNSLGIYLTVTNGETTYIDNVKVAEKQNITKMGGSLGKYYGDAALDNIVLSSYEDVSSKADYTINYYYNEVVIKSTEGNTAIGNSVEAENPITIDDVKYYAKDGETTSMTIVEGTNVLNVDLRKAYTYSYTVRGLDNNSNVLNSEILSGTSTEGNNVTIAYPQYLLYGNTLYNIVNNESGDYYRKSISPDADNFIYDLTYNNGTVSNVVFYTEAEKVNGASSQNMTSRASNGAVGYTSDADTYVNATPLEAGKYIIYIRTVTANSGSRTFNFKVGDEIVYSYNLSGSNTNNTQNSTEFTVTSTSTLSFACNGGGGNGNGLDWFYVQKSAESVTVTNAGFATYVSTYNLDFTNSAIKAYTVNVTEKGKAVLTQINKVQAGVPVLLYKDGGATENIPVCADYDAPGTNLLLAGTGAAVATTVGDYTNMILNNIDSKIGFYFANGQTVATNRAYLHIDTSLAPDAVGGSRMSFVFADEPTGISTAKAVEKANNEVYNLKGQRVAAPQKGLYIVNGKKVVIK